MESRDLRTSPQERGQPNRHDHRQRDTGAHQADRARNESRGVATVERSVVIAEDQVHETEQNRTDEADLECPKDVLLTGTEEHERPGHNRGGPRPRTGAHHHRAQQQRRDEVNGGKSDLVRDVGAQREQAEERAISKDRNRRPVFGVRPQEVAHIARIPLGEEAPLVAKEPAMTPVSEDDHGERDDEVCDEHRDRKPTRDSVVSTYLRLWLRLGTPISRRRIPRAAPQ